MMHKPLPVHTPTEHVFLLRSVLTRELDRRLSQYATPENYPAVEEIRAAMESVHALHRGGPSDSLPLLRKRVEWVKENWDVAAKYTAVRLAMDLLAELERVAGA